MKRFVAQLNDGSFINIRADKMELVDNSIRVYCSDELVGYVDVSCVLTAHFSEKVNKDDLR